MTTQPVHDPRPIFQRAADQAGHQVRAVIPAELGNPTPCTDYDVRALIGHMVAVLHKVARVGAGGDARDVPDPTVGVADDGWASAFSQARGEVESVWADDAMLDQLVALPWATLPGRVALDAYAHELTAHSWDLAYSIDGLAALDPDLAVRALEAFSTFAPPEERSREGRFGPVVPVPDDADVYTRLAAYLGRLDARTT